MSPYLLVEEGKKPVLILDIDNFKEVNNVKGHAGGDDVLVAIGDILRGHFGDRMVGRLGGEEFVVILEGEADFDRVQAFLEDVPARATIAGEPITISGGIAYGSKEGNKGQATYAVILRGSAPLREKIADNIICLSRCSSFFVRTCGSPSPQRAGTGACPYQKMNEKFLLDSGRSLSALGGPE